MKVRTDKYAHLPPSERAHAERGEPYCDPRIGEWRCLCPPHPRFDTSINMSSFSACGTCGAKRDEGPHIRASVSTRMPQ